MVTYPSTDTGFILIIINDVLSFDDQVVIVDTELGLLTVKGENIRINKLSLDTAEVIILFESGVMAQVSVTFAARQCAWPAWYCGAAHRVEVMGTEGSVVTQNDLPNYQFVSADGTAEQLNADQIDIDMSFYFLKCIAENKESIITTEDARHTVAIVEAAYKSAREGRKVALTEIG